MVIKFGGNVNDKCGNLTKKTELKSADSEHHLVVIPGTFWSRWYGGCDRTRLNISNVSLISNMWPS